MNTPEKRITIKPAKITMDKLGEMINNGFKESRRELLEVKEELIERMDSMDLRFDGMDSRFDDLEHQIGKIRLNYTTSDEANLLDGRVKKLEKRVLIAH